MVLAGFILLVVGSIGAIYALIVKVRGVAYEAIFEIDGKKVHVICQELPIPFFIYSKATLEDDSFIVSVSPHLAFTRNRLVEKEILSIIEYIRENS